LGVVDFHRGKLIQSEVLVDGCPGKKAMLKKLVHPIYHCVYRTFVRARCYWVDRNLDNRDLPPAMLRFRVSESISAKRFVDIGRGCAAIIAHHLSERGGLKKGSRILDFGCGCGRTIKWMTESYPEASFYGCDIDREAVDWCREHLQGKFQVNAPSPPLDCETASFDAVYCFSVFTHLNEAMQDAWLAELRRVIKPNGILIITVHGRNAAECLPDGDREVLASRGFLHKQSRKLRGFVPDWYQTTWHTQRYVLKKLTDLFGKAEYVEISDGIQDCVIAGGIATSPENRLSATSVGAHVCES
jgi:ubiquinone/menaquinone biosynthesis C-methylase UbiE